MIGPQLSKALQVVRVRSQIGRAAETTAQLLHQLERLDSLRARLKRSLQRSADDHGLGHVPLVCNLIQSNCEFVGNLTGDRRHATQSSATLMELRVLADGTQAYRAVSFTVESSTAFATRSSTGPWKMPMKNTATMVRYRHAFIGQPTRNSTGSLLSPKYIERMTPR